MQNFKYSSQGLKEQINLQRMTEADFEREATKLLRDLGLPSDTLNFFESDTANTSNWKSTIKAPPPPPKARRVSSTGTTSQYERRQRERAATVSVLKRQERGGIPWRNPSSYQDSSNATSGSRDSIKNRFSTGSPGVNVITTIPVSMSQPTPQNVSEQPQASSTPTKRQVHRPAPRAPPPGYQSKSAAAKRASTPSRTSVSPARSTSPSAASQGSGIPVLSSSRRLSPAAAMSSGASTTVSATHSNSITSSTSKTTNPPKPAVKPAASLSANRPLAVVNQSSTAAENKQGGFHAYESVDGNAASCLTTATVKSSSSSSPPKSASFKKPNSNLSVPKHQEISRRLSAPEKRNRDGKAVLESQKSVESSSSNRDQLKMLQLLSTPAKSSARKSSHIATKPDNKATVNGTKTVHPERTSVLSYSRIPVTSSSKTLSAPRESKSSSAPPSSVSRIPHPSGSSGTWAAGKSQHQPLPQQPKQHEKKPENEIKVGNATYDSLSPTPSPTDASLVKEEEFMLPEVPSTQQKANISGAYDRLTPKELTMIMQGEDLPKEENRERSPKVEPEENGVKETPPDPVEHFYAKVNKRRRHSEDQITSENRHSLTSPISDPGTAGSGTSNVQIGKRQSADETMQSNLVHSGTNPPSRTSARDTKSSERSNGVMMNGRSISIGSTATTASSSESVTDRQTPDSEERKSRISIDLMKQSLDNNMNVVASSTVQALQTLVEVMTPQPSPLKTDKKFSYDNEMSITPWYLLDTEEHDESGESSHPISPASEPVTSPTTVPQRSSKLSGDVNKIVGTSIQRGAPVQRKSSEQMSDSSRRTADPSVPRAATHRLSASDKAGLSSRGGPSDSLRAKGKQLSGQTGVIQTGQSSKANLPPPLESRTLSSPDHDYAILEGPEHDYAILDPEFNENFFGKLIIYSQIQVTSRSLNCLKKLNIT